MLVPTGATLLPAAPLELALELALGIETETGADKEVVTGLTPFPPLGVEDGETVELERFPVRAERLIDDEREVEARDDDGADTDTETKDADEVELTETEADDPDAETLDDTEEEEAADEEEDDEVTAAETATGVTATTPESAAGGFELSISPKVPLLIANVAASTARFWMVATSLLSVADRVDPLIEKKLGLYNAGGEVRTSIR